MIVVSAEGRIETHASNRELQHLFPSFDTAAAAGFPPELPADEIIDVVFATLQDRTVHTQCLQMSAGSGGGVRIRIVPLDTVTALLLYIEYPDLVGLTQELSLDEVIREDFEDWIVYFDSDNGVRYSSPACQAISGFSKEEWERGDVALDRLIHEEDRGAFLTHWQNVIEQGKPDFREFRIRRRDGAVTWIDHLSGPMISPEGELLGMVCRIRDISEQKRSLDLIRLMQFSLESSADAVFWLRSDSSFFYVNDAACRLLGYESAELYEMNAGDINPAHSQERWHDYWIKLREGQSLRFEAEFLDRNGGPLPVEISANFVSFEGREFNCSFVRNIAARKQYERDLVESRQQLSSALRFGRMGYFEYRVFSDQVSLPEETCELLGISRWIRELKGEDFLASILREDQITAFRDAVEELLQVDDPHHEITLELILTPTEANTRWMNTRLRLREKHGHHDAVITGVVQDITEMKRSESALRSIIKATTAVGEKFFPALALELSATLNVRYACICESSNDDKRRLRSLAFAGDRELVEDYMVTAGDALFTTVLEHDVYQCGSNARAIFPSSLLLAALEVESFLGMCLTDTCGRVIGLMVVMHDRPMTESRFTRNILQIFAGRAAAEIERIRTSRHSERLKEQFEHIFDHSIDGICVVRDGALLLANPAARQMFGYTQGEVLTGRSMLDFIHPDEQMMIRENITRRFAGEAVADTYEVRGVKKDGAIIDIDVRVSSYYLGGSPHLMVILRDITERKRTERERQEQRQFLEAVLEATPSLVYIYDLKEKQNIWANRDFAEALGYEPEYYQQLGSDLLASLIHPDDLAQLVAALDSFRDMKDGEVREHLYRAKHADGSWRWLTSRNVVFHRDSEGRVSQMLGAALDVTARIEAKEKAEQSDRLKDAFLATVSHEIRTPLNIIGGFTTLLQQEFETVPTQNSQEFFDSVQRGISRLNRTVDLILSVSRIRSGDIQLNPIEVNLSRMLPPLVEDMRPFAAEKNIVLHVDMEADTISAVVDEYSITQAFVNLIDNGIKFTEQGSVMVRVYKERNGTPSVDIQDTGIGIAPEYLPHLYDRYSQEEMGFTRPYEGLGLGLSLVKEYVTLNGGEVTVRSVKGEGTTFTVRFPDSGITGNRNLSLMRVSGPDRG